MQNLPCNSPLFLVFWPRPEPPKRLKKENVRFHGKWKVSLDTLSVSSLSLSLSLSFSLSLSLSLGAWTAMVYPWECGSRGFLRKLSIASSSQCSVPGPPSNFTVTIKKQAKSLDMTVLEWTIEPPKRGGAEEKGQDVNQTFSWGLWNWSSRSCHSLNEKRNFEPELLLTLTLNSACMWLWCHLSDQTVSVLANRQWEMVKLTIMLST